MSFQNIKAQVINRVLPLNTKQVQMIQHMVVGDLISGLKWATAGFTFPIFKSLIQGTSLPDSSDAQYLMASGKSHNLIKMTL